MNDENRAEYKTHINLNKSFKSIEVNSQIEIILVQGWYKKIDGINIGKNLEKRWSNTKTVEKKLITPWVGKNDEKKPKKS